MDLIEHAKPLIHWITVHPGLAGLATFIIAFLESIAIVGLIIPGSVVMTAIGTLVGAGIIPLWDTLLWAAGGAILGDILSYQVGYRYTYKITYFWPFSKYPQIIKRAEEFFENHGGKSVFLGRFVGPMRPIIPIVAGMSRMSKIKFYISCVIAGILWAPAYMLAGIFIGAASQQLAPQAATRFIVIIVAILIAIWLTAWFFKWLISKCCRYIDQKSALLWQKINNLNCWRWFSQFLQDPLAPDHHGQFNLVIATLILAGLILFMFISVNHQGIVTILNQPTHQLFLSLHSAFTTKLMIILTFLGYKYLLVLAIFVCVMWLTFHYHWRAAAHLAAVVIFTALLILLGMHLVYSPRPEGLIYSLQGNSFPSGHAALSVAIYGFIAVIIARNLPKPSQRKAIYFITSILCLLIIISRLYLGTHWLSDIVGGTLLGLFAVFLGALSFRRKTTRKMRPFGLLIALFLCLAFGMVWQITQNYQELIQVFTPYWPTYTANQAEWWQQDNSNPPLYRTNRLGNPVEIMNVQWMAQLSDIEETLTKNGWYTSPKLTVKGLINRVSAMDKEKHLPFFAPLYLGQSPELLAVKHSDEGGILILQLWDANLDFADSKLPLWVGALSYKIPHHNKFWLESKYNEHLLSLTPPPQTLVPSLKNYKWRIIYYDNLQKPERIRSYQWQGGVLLIKPAK